MKKQNPFNNPLPTDHQSICVKPKRKKESETWWANPILTRKEFQAEAWKWATSDGLEPHHKMRRT